VQRAADQFTRLNLDPLDESRDCLTRHLYVTGIERACQAVTDGLQIGVAQFDVGIVTNSAWVAAIFSVRRRASTSASSSLHNSVSETGRCARASASRPALCTCPVVEMTPAGIVSAHIFALQRAQ
jgi:hypothetical protein